jgi:hypothetical protein
MKAKIRQRLGLLILVWFLSYSFYLTSAIATPLKPRFKLPSPPQRGIVGNRSAAASRNPKCPAVDLPLTAILPAYVTDPQQPERLDGVWGLTGMDRPTFWFYVPYAKNQIVNLSFTLEDDSSPADRRISDLIPIVPSQIPGLMSVVLPDSIAPLSLNRSYHWFLKLNLECTIGKRPFFVDGWIQRVEIDRPLRDRIQQAAPIDRAAIYAENGLFYDAVATLATQKVAKLQDPTISQAWQNLLDSIELSKLPDRSILNK